MWFSSSFPPLRHHHRVRSPIVTSPSSPFSASFHPPGRFSPFVVIAVFVLPSLCRPRSFSSSSTLVVADPPDPRPRQTSSSLTLLLLLVDLPPPPHRLSSSSSSTFLLLLLDPPPPPPPRPSSSSSSLTLLLILLLLLGVDLPPPRRLSCWDRLAATGHSLSLGSPPHDVLSLSFSLSPSLPLSSSSSLFCRCQVLGCYRFGQMG